MIIATLYIPIFCYNSSIDDSSSGHEKSGASVGRAPHYTRQPAADPPGKKEHARPVRSTPARKEQKNIIVALYDSEGEDCVKSRTDVLFFHEAVCAGAPQPALMADGKPPISNPHI